MRTNDIQNEASLFTVLSVRCLIISKHTVFPWLHLLIQRRGCNLWGYQDISQTFAKEVPTLFYWT